MVRHDGNRGSERAADGGTAASPDATIAPADGGVDQTPCGRCGRMIPGVWCERTDPSRNCLGRDMIWHERETAIARD